LVHEAFLRLVDQDRADWHNSLQGKPDAGRYRGQIILQLVRAAFNRGEPGKLPIIRDNASFPERHP
jgi:hypothetical protein